MKFHVEFHSTANISTPLWRSLSSFYNDISVFLFFSRKSQRKTESWKNYNTGKLLDFSLWYVVLRDFMWRKLRAIETILVCCFQISQALRKVCVKISALAVEVLHLHLLKRVVSLQNYRLCLFFLPPLKNPLTSNMEFWENQKNLHLKQLDTWSLWKSHFPWVIHQDGKK